MSIELSGYKSDQAAENNETVYTDADTAVPATDAIGLYLNQIGKIDLLKPEDEIELAKDIEAGFIAQDILEQEAFQSHDEFQVLKELREKGDEAKRRLVEANLRLVVPIAKRYSGRGVPFLDLIQEGNEGLMYAAQAFDYKKGFKFSTLATFKITERIIRSFFAQSHPDPVTRKTGEMLSKLRNVTRRVSDQLGRTPTKEELASEMKLSMRQMTDLLGIRNDKLSLDMEIGEFNTPLGVFVEEIDSDPLDALIRESMQKELDGLFTNLDEQERVIMRGRYGFDTEAVISHQGLARKLKISHSKVKEIEEKTLHKLRVGEHASSLREYFS